MIKQTDIKSIDEIHKIISSNKSKFPKYNFKYFVVCPGKTGSTTLQRSFKGSLHAHDNIYLQRNSIFRNHNITLTDLFNYGYFINKNKPLVITSFREPFSRTISAFFQKSRRRNVNTYKDVERILYGDYLMTYREDYYPYYSRSILYKDDRYVKGLEGLLIHPFNHEEKYEYYETDKLRVLALRLNDVSKWNDIIPKVLLQEDKHYFKYSPGNLSYNKWYNQIYNETLENIKIPKNVFRKKWKYHQPVIRHFLSRQEISKLKEYWKNRIY